MMISNGTVKNNNYIIFSQERNLITFLVAAIVRNYEDAIVISFRLDERSTLHVRV